MGSEDLQPRGVPGPAAAQHGGELHPGKRATSSYDNNLASWTNERGVRAEEGPGPEVLERGFLWSGQDYIGEPTPYDVFPVKTSFLRRDGHAGFAKDAYYLFASQWTTEPMVTSSDGLDQLRAWSAVSVWVYANVATVELFRNGTSLGLNPSTRR